LEKFEIKTELVYELADVTSM